MHVSTAKLQFLKPAFDGFQVPSGNRLEEEDRLNPLGNLLENFGSLLKHGKLPEMEHVIFEQGMLVHFVLCDVGVCFILVNGFKVSGLLHLEICLSPTITPVRSCSANQNITSSSQTEVQQQSVRGMEDREKEENSWKCKKNSYGVEEVCQAQTVQALQALSIIHVVSNFFKAVIRVVKGGHVSFFEKFMLEKLKLDDKQSSHRFSSSCKNGNKIVHVLEEGSGDDVHGGSRADERPLEDPCSKKENAFDQGQFGLSVFSQTDGYYPEGMGIVYLWTIAKRREKVQYAFHLSQLPSSFQTFNQGVIDVRQTSHALQMGVTDSSSPQFLGTVTHSKVKAVHGPRSKVAHRCLDKSSHAIVQWAMQPNEAFEFQIQDSLQVPNEKAVPVAHGYESQIEKDFCLFPTIYFLKTKETFPFADCTRDPRNRDL